MDLFAKIRRALVELVNQIALEDAATPRHAERVAVMRRVVNDFDAQAPRFTALYVTAFPGDSDQTDQAAVTSSANALVDRLARLGAWQTV